jgi:hypothetical protein
VTADKETPAMKQRTRITCSLTTLVALTPALAGPAPAQEAPSAEKIGEEQAYTLGTAANLWGFTMNELYRVRSAFLAKPGNAVNRFDHVRALRTPKLARTEQLRWSWPNPARKASSFSADETCDLGNEAGPPVSQDYGSHGNKFIGRAERPTVGWRQKATRRRASKTPTTSPEPASGLMMI